MLNQLLFDTQMKSKVGVIVQVNTGGVFLSRTCCVDLSRWGSHCKRQTIITLSINHRVKRMFSSEFCVETFEAAILVCSDQRVLTKLSSVKGNIFLNR